MKFTGVLLIATAGVGLGLYYCRRLHRRAEWLYLCERLLDALQDKLSYTAQSLKTLWCDFADNAVFCTYPLVKDTAQGLLRGETFHASFDAAVTSAASRGLVLPSEETVLRELGTELGCSDRASQSECICRCRDRLAQATREARQIAHTRGRIYTVMGIAGGLSVALLML